MQKTKIRQRRMTSRLKWSYLLVVLVALAAVGGYFAWSRHHHQTQLKDTGVVKTPFGRINYNPSNKQDNHENNARKASSNPAETLDNGPVATPMPAFSASIVSANVNSGNIHVGTLVSGVTNGSCTLTVSKAGQRSITRTANVQLDVNNYDCGVFNIATGTLPASGEWTLTLTVTDNGEQASDSTTVTT